MALMHRRSIISQSHYTSRVIINWFWGVMPCKCNAQPPALFLSHSTPPLYGVTYLPSGFWLGGSTCQYLTRSCQRYRLPIAPWKSPQPLKLAKGEISEGNTNTSLYLSLPPSISHSFSFSRRRQARARYVDHVRQGQLSCRAVVNLLYFL